MRPSLPEHGAGLEGYRVAVLARSGHGKSFLARYLVEQLLEKRGYPLVVLEPVTEYESLLEAFDGLLFRDEGGVPLEPQTMAEASLEAPVVVINYEDQPMTRARRVLSQYLTHLIDKAKKLRRPFLLLVEEAHLLAPQRFTRETATLLEQMEYIAKVGRKLGINYILVSQRPANLHKDVLSQVNATYLGAFSHPLDVRAARSIAEALGHALDPQELAGLEKGVFLELLPGHRARVRAPGTRTRHLGGTPFDASPLLSKRLDYEELIEKAKKRLEEAQKTITIPKEEYETLKRRIRELEAEKAKLEKELEAARIKLETIQLVSQKLAEGNTSSMSVPRDLLPELETRILRALEEEPTHRMSLYNLARKTGTTRRSSRFHKALRTLKTLGLIDYDLRKGWARLNSTT